MPRGVSTTPRKKKSGDPVDKHVGEQLRRFRMLKDMSQTKIAEALDLTFQQVQKYEKGANRISAGRLQKLATLLEVRVEDFFPDRTDGDRLNGSNDLMTQLAQTRDGIKLARAYLGIKNPEMRNAIVDLVEVMAGKTE